MTAQSESAFRSRTVVQSRRFSAKRLVPVVFVLLRWLLISGIAYVILYPLLVKLASSFMSRADLYDPAVHWIPKGFTFVNYAIAIDGMRYWQAFLNSFSLALAVSIFQVASCTVVGYGLARFRFFLNGFLFALVILTLVVPPQVVMIPLYLNFRYFNIYGLLPDPGLNLLNTIWPIILTSLTAGGMRNGLFIYIMRQVFKSMSKELEDAAYVDGAGFFRTFAVIMIPAGAVAGMVVVFLFAFVWQWNEHYFTHLYMGNQLLLTNTLAQLAQSASLESGNPMELSMVNNTGALLFIAPLLLLYAFMQRYFLESVERSGLTS